MDGEVAKRNLYEAAITGEVARFILLLEEDPYLVNVASFECSRNILHIATMHGKQDIVAILLEKAPEMCWWRDSQGMNPVHIAAMNGHVEILEMLLQLDSSPAMERLHRGQTVLHLCVKHRKITMLRILAERLGELVYAKDDDGETILHLAVRCNQLEIIQYLVENNIIEKQTPNSMGKTALQILKESPTRTAHYSEIEKHLKKSHTYNSEERLKAILPKLNDIAMVVMVLIATMAFQAATSSHRAGEAVMASTHPKIYKQFVRANTIAFISSLVTIFLIATTQKPTGRLYFLFIAVYAMWLQ